MVELKGERVDEDSRAPVDLGLYLEDPLGRNSCLFREERLFPSWGGNQLFAAEMFLLPRIFPFRNPVRQRLHILEELNIFVVYIGHFCLER